jgi:hypothetical protein
MNYTLVGAALLALAVVATGAVAAAPGNAPVDAPSDDRPDQAGNDRGAAGPGAAADAGPAAAADNAGERGPPADLPGQAPDFVFEIHDLVRQHLDGSLDGVLGDRIVDVTPDEDQPANETAA